MSEIILSRVHPDYAQIRAQLQLALSGLDTWKDLLPTATGQALVDFVAAIGDMDQFGIEHSYKEAFLDARMDSSVYAIAKLLGVRLGRRTPGSVLVTLTRPSNTTTLTIPAYTAFSGSGVPLFNRETVVFNIGMSAVNIQLYEGQVKTITTLADGSDFQLFTAAEADFTVSDLDVQVFAGVRAIPVVREGLWNSKGTPAVQDLTFNKGEMLLLFGNSQYGYKPSVNTSLTFRYVVTSGLAANSGAFANQAISCAAFAQVKGQSTSGLVGGADQREAAFYRRFGPQLVSAAERAKTEDEYQALAAAYPSVVDALVVGQRKLSPADNRFMNLVRVSLLKNSTWGTPQYDAFTRYYEARTMFPTRFYFEEPLPVSIPVSANIYCRLEGDLTEIQSAITSALTALFAPRVGIIGLNFFRSDIYEAIRLASPYVEFVELLTPTADVFPMFQTPKPPTVIEVAGGSIPAGLIAYAVTVITPTGETLPDNIGTQNLVSDAAARITWNPVAGALGYKIYGRTFPGAKLIATVPAGTTTYLDNGTASSNIDPPAFDTSGVRYCALGALTLNMYYTNRRLV